MADSNHLSVVGPGEGGVEPFDEEGNFVATSREPAPRPPYMFGRQKIELTNMKVTSASNLEIDDRILEIDDYVELKVVGRVVSVDHKMNDKTGKTSRVHLVKVIEVDYGKAWSPAGGIEYL